MGPDAHPQPGGDDVFPEIDRRFDPSVHDGSSGDEPHDSAAFQVVAGRREQAWRNAERLATATATPER